MTVKKGKIRIAHFEPPTLFPIPYLVPVTVWCCTVLRGFSQKWLTLHGHDSPEDAVAKLKKDGYQVSHFG